MTAAENPRAVAGDNKPPDPLLVEASERVDNANRWLTERGDWKKWTPEEADKANFFLSQIGATYTALDNRRLDEGREFKKQQDAVYKDPLSLLDRAKNMLAPLRRAWLLREDERVQAEKAKAAAEAKRLADEAEAAAQEAAKARETKGGDVLRSQLAADKAAEVADAAVETAEAIPDRATISGAYSPRATGLRTVWKAKITDLREAAKHYNKKANPHRAKIAAALQEVILRIAGEEARLHKDATKAPPGIEFYAEKL